MTQLSKYFTEAEFLRSETAIRKGINNTWEDPSHKENAVWLCKNFLDRIREATDRPIIISSGYRCKKVNTLVGGSPPSAHKKGLAADFTCKGLDLKALFNLIQNLQDKSIIPKFDQLIFEFDAWIHLGVAREGVKGEVLRAVKSQGKTIYTHVGRLA